MKPYCGTRIRLPRDRYVVRERRLRRLLRPAALVWEVSGTAPPTEIEGMVNVGPDADEIWVERTLTAPEKRFVITHELVHARRQMSGEEFADYRLEERIVELEAIARAGTRLLRSLPNGLALTLLYNFLTDAGMHTAHTAEGLGKIHARISVLLGGIKTTAC